jgi:hypothetical protein
VKSFRAASLCFVVALVWVPRPALAQGPSNNLTAINARVTALEAALAAETAARVAAVSALQTALANEASARAAADSTLQTSLNSEASSRAAADAALDARVAKFEGNITAADLEGTYNFYFVATGVDEGPNTITSYFIKGTMTLGSGGTGQFTDTSASGRQLTERTPNLTWLAGNVGGTFDGPFSWVYNNGVVTINAGGDINDVTPTAGGQVMVGVQGGPPGNNQAILVATRQPSN